MYSIFVACTQTPAGKYTIEYWISSFVKMSRCVSEHTTLIAVVNSFGSFHADSIRNAASIYSYTCRCMFSVLTAIVEPVDLHVPAMEL